MPDFQRFDAARQIQPLFASVLIAGSLGSKPDVCTEEVNGSSVPRSGRLMVYTARPQRMSVLTDRSAAPWSSPKVRFGPSPHRSGVSLLFVHIASTNPIPKSTANDLFRIVGIYDIPAKVSVERFVLHLKRPQ